MRWARETSVGPSRSAPVSIVVGPFRAAADFLHSHKCQEQRNSKRKLPFVSSQIKLDNRARLMSNNSLASPQVRRFDFERVLGSPPSSPAPSSVQIVAHHHYHFSSAGDVLAVAVADLSEFRPSEFGQANQMEAGCGALEMENLSGHFRRAPK